MINIALVDDHTLLRKGIKRLVETDANVQVVVEAAHGHDLLQQLKTSKLPDIAVIDINMPVMDGYETIRHLSKSYATIKIIVLSMLDGEDAVMNMINQGVSAFIAKDCDPAELSRAIHDVYNKGIHFGGLLTKKRYRRKAEQKNGNGFSGVQYLTPRETEFIRLCATDLSYAEIAVKMKLGTKTVENYKDHIFQKLNINNRNSLTLFAIKNGIHQSYHAHTGS